MKDRRDFDVIIVGGSYSGLAAGLALGRALRQILIIDSGKPCNRQTPYSHNFITQDGKSPREIAITARLQVEKYDTVAFFNGTATQGTKTENGFEILTGSGESFRAKKVIFATGIKDIMPDIVGYAECWGISVLHCPYCHGYEVKNEKTGVLGNGELIFEFLSLISNWTNDLTLFTNGTPALTAWQIDKIKKHNIPIVETEIEKFVHSNGYLQNVVFKGGTSSSVKALYTKSPFEQHCTIPETLGCEMTEQGYIKSDPFQKTTVHGVFSSGDNTTRMRSIANSVGMGTMAGMMANKEIIEEEF